MFPIRAMFQTKESQHFAAWCGGRSRMLRLLTAVQFALLFAMASVVHAVDFRVEGKAFLLDGKEFQVRSGEIHYSRVPRAEWGNRIALARAMGLNTICTYVFWGYHESPRGEFDFTGEKDFIAFVRECERQGMKAIVRPGPYVCAEWDLGGLPAWLLAEPGIKMRTLDPRFMGPASAWMERMGRMLQPLSVANGGPLLMVQVENEYGHFAKDTNYMIALTKALRSGGYKGMVFTGDGQSPGMLKNGHIPGELKSVNFGRNAAIAFFTLGHFFPNQPDFTSEFWIGWYDEWGSARQRINTNWKLDNFQEILKRGASFNLYMFHGGTTRGYWTGGNWKGGYSSATCCHDWAALLDESGRPNDKYFAFRRMLQDFHPKEVLPEVPQMKPASSVGTIRLTGQSRLVDAMPAGQETPVLKTMEHYGQSTGFIVYRTQVEGPLEGTLNLAEAKDRVYALLDGKLVGISGRTMRGVNIALKIPAGKHRLDLMVENMGRVCYGGALSEEHKGLTGTVLLADKELGPFETVSLTMQAPPAGKYEEIRDGKTLGSMALYRGELKISTPADTWLDLRGFGRGTVWINGQNLGRYWKIGPVQGVFLPGCFMKKGEPNEIVVMELEADTCPAELPTSAESLWLR